jgi:hypothetical protein
MDMVTFSYYIERRGIVKIEKNSRQMPTMSSIIKNKDYCDILYAWIQCNSERAAVNVSQRRIDKKKIKWAAIEREFTVTLEDGTTEKLMEARTIKKYFKYLESEGLIELDPNGEYYLITVLEADEAHLIEHETLRQMAHSLRRHAIDIYIYLFNRYYACGQKPFIATLNQIKQYIGISKNTSSNNLVISDTLKILKQLGLLDYWLKQEGDQSFLEFKWVKNKLS